MISHSCGWVVFLHLTDRRDDSSNGGACPEASGIAQYGFSRCSLCTKICSELFLVSVIGQDLHDELGLKFRRLARTPTMTDHPNPVSYLVQGGSSMSSAHTFYCFSRRISWGHLHPVDQLPHTLIYWGGLLLQAVFLKLVWPSHQLWTQKNCIICEIQQTHFACFTFCFNLYTCGKVKVKITYIQLLLKINTNFDWTEFFTVIHTLYLFSISTFWELVGLSINN